MKIIYAWLFCALFCLNAFAQTDEEKETAGKTAVEEIQLSRAAGKDGELGELTTVFAPTDVPIYCSVGFRANGKSIAVKMNVVAVAASGLKANAVVVSVNYKTNGTDAAINFNASPSGKSWAAGRYRVDILLDGKTAKSLAFEIQNPAKQAMKQASFKPKPKTKPRKN